MYTSAIYPLVTRTCQLFNADVHMLKSASCFSLETAGEKKTLPGGQRQKQLLTADSRVWVIFVPPFLSNSPTSFPTSLSITQSLRFCPLVQTLKVMQLSRLDTHHP